MGVEDGKEVRGAPLEVSSMDTTRVSSPLPGSKSRVEGGRVAGEPTAQDVESAPPGAMP